MHKLDTVYDPYNLLMIVEEGMQLTWSASKTARNLDKFTLLSAKPATILHMSLTLTLNIIRKR